MFTAAAETVAICLEDHHSVERCITSVLSPPPPTRPVNRSPAERKPDRLTGATAGAFSALHICVQCTERPGTALTQPLGEELVNNSAAL